MTVTPASARSFGGPPPEIDPLLAPVDPQRPTGESLRFDPMYDAIKLAREQEDASLPQGVWKRELKRADWSAVADLCSQALTTRSKDLQIAAWLGEAWIHLHGYGGAERALRLMARLCRSFWNDLYPPLEGGSSDARVAPIEWAAEKLVLPLKAVPMTSPQGEDAQPYSWSDWESGQYLANLIKSKPEAAADAEQSGMVSQAKFNVSISLTPGSWFASVEQQITGALSALDELQQVLVERLGPTEAPSLNTFGATLQAIRAFASRVAQERVESGETTSSEEVAAAIAQVQAGLNSPEPRPGAVTSRAEAYQKLRDAAEYLMRTEPHSPVPYLVKRAISWGNLSLAELLEELLQKNADLPTIYTLLGIKRS